MIVLPFLYFSIKLFKYIHANAPPGYEHLPRLEDLKMVAFFALGLSIVEKTVLYFSTPIFNSIVKDQDNLELRDKYVRKCNESIVKIVLYGGIIFHTRRVLAGTKLLPWYLGGTIGSFEAMEEGMPFIELPPGAAECLLLFMGQHVHFLVDLLLNHRNRPDFNETLLHHICAVSLNLCTFFANTRGLGLVICYLHALSEPWVNLARILSSTHYKTATAAAGIGMFIVFGYTRIIVLPYMTWRVWHRKHPGLPQFDNVLTCDAVFLTCLQLLHFHWFRLIVKMLTNYVETGENVDAQRIIEKSK